MGESNSKKRHLDDDTENATRLIGENSSSWEKFYAEIIHQVNSNKLWPRNLRKSAIILAGPESRQCSWTVWRSEEQHYVFGIKIKHKEKCEYHFLKPTKKFRKKTEIRLLKGKLPTASSTPSTDKRAFFLKRPQQDPTVELLCHSKTGKYLTSDDVTGKLKLTSKSVLAHGWLIAEQNAPTEDI